MIVIDTLVFSKFCLELSELEVRQVQGKLETKVIVFLEKRKGLKEQHQFIIVFCILYY